MSDNVPLILIAIFAVGFSFTFIFDGISAVVLRKSRTYRFDGRKTKQGDIQTHMTGTEAIRFGKTLLFFGFLLLSVALLTLIVYRSLIVVYLAILVVYYRYYHK
jgi:hypothetical protein